MGTQEGPKLGDLLEKRQRLYAVCSEGRQVPANKRRLPRPVMAASWEGDRLSKSAQSFLGVSLLLGCLGVGSGFGSLAPGS